MKIDNPHDLARWDMYEHLYTIEQKLDKLLEKKKAPKPRSSIVKYPQEFEDCWSEYPKRFGSNPKKRALQAWFARGDESTFCNGDGVAAERATRLQMLMGTVAYCKFCDATIEDGRFVMQAATFFGPDKHYENDWTIPVNKNLPKSNDELQAWAVDNGYRIAAPGETYPQYRQALEQLRRG